MRFGLIPAAIYRDLLEFGVTCGFLITRTQLFKNVPNNLRLGLHSYLAKASRLNPDIHPVLFPDLDSNEYFYVYFLQTTMLANRANSVESWIKDCLPYPNVL
jgi:hypothetical protein